MRSEDKRFLEHAGVDWQRRRQGGLGATLCGNRHARRSTLSMQLVGLLDADSAPPRPAQALLEKLDQSLQPRMRLEPAKLEQTPDPRSLSEPGAVSRRTRKASAAMSRPAVRQMAARAGRAGSRTRRRAAARAERTAAASGRPARLRAAARDGKGRRMPVCHEFRARIRPQRSPRATSFDAGQCTGRRSTPRTRPAPGPKAARPSPASACAPASMPLASASPAALRRHLADLASRTPKTARCWCSTTPAAKSSPGSVRAASLSVPPRSTA
jgi:hypothetical protein